MSHQLSYIISNIGLIIFLKIIAKYLIILKPIVYKLQAVNANLHIVYQHIHSNVLNILKKRRFLLEENFSIIFNDIINN